MTGPQPRAPEQLPAVAPEGFALPEKHARDEDEMASTRGLGLGLILAALIVVVIATTLVLAFGVGPARAHGGGVKPIPAPTALVRARGLPGQSDAHVLPDSTPTRLRRDRVVEEGADPPLPADRLLRDRDRVRQPAQRRLPLAAPHDRLRVAG